ncbi:metallophosphoesterase family protein [Deinococcus peraridilitoris]|uniref:metallophosphoesterase family protein n=1 Tax=Deinococcus peraridilitoris TaxID=432329 RepID=UPI00059C5F84|nr:metallophosphoesterase family protein [Deinococcus peraridilitoris]
MRLLLLSDIHANLAALEAVLGDAERQVYDRVVCLGDVLGYGPQPREVLARLRDLNARCILGNHDLWALQLARGANRQAQDNVVMQVLHWQLQRLSSADLNGLAAWPEVHDEELGGFTVRFRHGSPLSLLAYVSSLARAREAFAAWEGQVCFVGHTHLPGVYATVDAPPGEWVKHQSLSAGGRFLWAPRARLILNPGSVGQPRDGNPQASYGLFDIEQHTFEVFRVPYDVGFTQAALRSAGLPASLGARLAVGE